jgi:protein SCO1
MKMTIRVMCVAGAVGCAMLLSAPALAHGGQDHAAMAAAAGTEGYKRSLRTYAAIPDVVLIDANAKPVRLRELLATGDPVMVNFIFTTCTTICPVMTQVFADARARLGGEAKSLRMVSISIDPENDTPAQLKAYSKKFGADARWTFLTGRIEDINNVQRAFDIYSNDKMTHTPLTLIHQPRSTTWVRIDGFANPGQLAGEYRSVAAQ